MAGRHIQERGGGRPPRYEKTPEREYGYEDGGYEDGSYEDGGYADDYRAGTEDWEPAWGRARRSRKWLRWGIPVIVVAALLLAAFGGVMVYASHISSLDTIYPNISVNGVDVGGLTVEEAEKKLSESADPYRDASLKVVFPFDSTLTITAEQLGLSADAAGPAQTAYAYGRGGSALESLRAYMACQKTPVALTWEAETKIDETALRALLADAAAKVNESLKKADVRIDEAGVTLVKGMDSARVDVDALCREVETAFLAGDYSDIECELVDTASDEDAESRLQAIYDEVYVEPVNAVYDKETGGATESKTGVSFDMADALSRWSRAEPGDEVFVPFIFTEPEVDAETLLSRLFADCLAERSTSLSGSSSNRINNVTLAAQALNNYVVNPGETFDYNSCLGERTSARGYREAGAYSGGQHVTAIGGGICQNSSTLYYCALYANLKITVRDSHYFLVTYLPRGYDATVSWGGPDFRFVNSRNYPIRIKAWVSNGSLTVQIWGTDEDGSYVKMTSDEWEDSNFYYAQTYRNVYAADGTLLSSGKESYSRYHKYEAGAQAGSSAAETEPIDVPPEPTQAPATDPPAPTDAPPAHTDPPPAQTDAPPAPTDAPPAPTDAPPAPTEAPPPPTDAPPPATEAPAPDPDPEPDLSGCVFV